MKEPASPVFTARMTDIYFVNKYPELTRMAPGMELKMFCPDATVEMQQPLPPVEHILQEGATDHYVHLHLNGITAKVPPQELHRLSTRLLIARDMITDAYIACLSADD
jgi:hypothetical protein